MKTERIAAPQPESSQAEAPVEFELKFGIPDENFDELRASFVAKRAKPLALKATYYDTADGRVSAAGLSLRVRREGARWVQTLKAPGGRNFERIEDEVPIGNGIGARAFDPARHGQPALAALRKALGLKKRDPWPAFRPVFEVDVRRLARRIDEGDSCVEVVLDEGEVRAAGRKLPLRELEVELLRGNAADAIKLARRWRSRWGLWLHTAGKATRGALLARGELFSAATTASRLRFDGEPRSGEFIAAVLSNCLQQVLANAGEVGDGSHGDEHVHQLRVGLRRLRTALRDLPPLLAERTSYEPILAKVFRALGEQRDRGYVLWQVQPLVEAAGGSPLHLPPGFLDPVDPPRLVRDDAFQDALICLWAREQELRGLRGERAKPMLRVRLAKLHKAVTRCAEDFAALAPDRQHLVRKRLKRLRYLAEFAAPLFDGDAVKRYLRHLKPAQERLGELNDHVMAQAIYEALAGADAGARFAVQWLRSRHAGDVKRSRRALRQLAAAPVFWKGR